MGNLWPRTSCETWWLGHVCTAKYTLKRTVSPSPAKDNFSSPTCEIRIGKDGDPPHHRHLDPWKRKLHISPWTTWASDLHWFTVARPSLTPVLRCFVFLSESLLFFYTSWCLKCWSWRHHFLRMSLGFNVAALLSCGCCITLTSCCNVVNWLNNPVVAIFSELCYFVAALQLIHVTIQCLKSAY